jgi:hypothetical protein
MKKMALRILFPAIVLGLLCLPALADTVTYQVTVDTSSQSGNYGYIDLQLNQGTLGSLPITATIAGFAGGALNPSDGNNFATGSYGSLPGALTILADISTDYFEGLTFGNSISFDITLSGAGVNLAGLAGGASGTNFVFGFYDSAINPLFTSDPSGATGLIEIANDGTVGVNALSGPSGGQSLASFEPLDNPPVVTPEPSTLSLFVCAGAAFLLLRHGRSATVAR